MEETIFSKIIRKEIPAKIVFQDERVTAFRDIQPKTPVHILIIPNQHIPTAADIKPEDESLVGYMMVVAAKIAKDEGISEDGYRLIINCKEYGGQEVNHLHMHLLGGKKLGRMVN